MVNPDVSSKLYSGFRAVRGRVVSYNHSLKKYSVRPDVANYDTIECPALDVGIDAPYTVNEEVLLQRIPNQGWLIMGRIPTSRNVRARTPQQLPESEPEEVDEIAFQEPDNDEALFHARPGDMVVRRGRVKSIVSKIGVIAHKVSDTCYRHMSKAKSVIVDRCFRYVLSVPRATFNLFLDRQTEEPKLEAQFNPQSMLNAMRFSIGGGVADGEDGIDVAMGQFARLLFQLLPGEQKVTYTQNSENTRIESSLAEFLLQFGTGEFRWTSAGLLVSKDDTVVQIDPASLEISTSALNISAETVTAEATGTVTVTANALIMQQFYWLTVVQRLNNLLLNFQTHVHTSDVPGAPTSVPTGNPVNEKGEPIGTPILPNEPPISV